MTLFPSSLVQKSKDVEADTFGSGEIRKGSEGQREREAGRVVVGL